jgi:hypothetical protein
MPSPGAAEGWEGPTSSMAAVAIKNKPGKKILNAEAKTPSV